MTCSEIEIRLPLYLEELLSAEERNIIAGHLASCPGCCRSFAELKRAEQLLQNLEEVEPPPFFEQRIMSRVREEAGRKKGIFRRLFYPLHIKVPIQALATLLVAVLAFHIYQTGEPEMKRIAPLSRPPLTEPGRGLFEAGSAETPPSPSAVAPVQRAPARDLPEKSRQPLVAPPPEKSQQAARMAESWAPVREEPPAAAKPADPDTGAKRKELPPAGEVALDKAQQRSGKQDADRAPGTLSPERKRRAKTVDAAAGESRQAPPAPSPSRTAAVAATERSVMEVTIRVGETAVALREIEGRLGRVNARIIDTERRGTSVLVKVEIAAPNVAALLELLEPLGSVRLETPPPAVPDGKVAISIQLVSPP